MYPGLLYPGLYHWLATVPEPPEELPVHCFSSGIRVRSLAASGAINCTTVAMAGVKVRYLGAGAVTSSTATGVVGSITARSLVTSTGVSACCCEMESV